SATPGAVVPALQEATSNEYDQRGLLVRVVERNAVDADVVTTYGYDDAGRLRSARRGVSGERRVGYDIGGRVVFRNDGDEGIHRVRYDAWDRPWHEELQTGALVEREWDEAGNQIRESVCVAESVGGLDGDESCSASSTPVLAESRM